jgi:hypothetical protein
MRRTAKEKISKMSGLRLVFTLAAIAWLLAACRLTADDAGAPKKIHSLASATTQSTPKPEKKPKRTLSGAELYAIHCNRCHPERYAPERTAEQWQTILLHMRTRANLPVEHAKAILKYLQEDSGK